MKILVAEDSRTQALGLRAELQSYGFDVVVAYNGRQALTAAGRERPDVILSDVLMPDIDGFRLCRELRLDPELRKIPTVLRTSAFLNEEDRNFALAAGASDYITKDVGGRDLVRILEDAVKNHGTAEPGGDLGDDTFHGTYERRLLSQLVEKAAHAERVGEDLQQTQRLLEAVMDNSPAIVWVKDLDGRYVMVNSTFRQLFNVSSEEVQGKTSALVLSAEDRVESDKNFRSVVGSGKAMEFEERTHQADGIHTWLSTKFPLRDRAGEIYAVAGISLDITERKMLEQQLMRAQKVEGLGRLAGGIAHDFNNLLSVIINYTLFASEGLDDDDRRAGDLREVMKAAQRGADLVRQLVTYSKGGTASIETVDVNEAIVEIEGLLRGALSANIDLVTELDPHLGKVMINLDQLGQVFLNLLVNARDAMPDGGTISIATRTVDLKDASPGSDRGPAKKCARISVTDTGHGMTRETVERIFDPFFTTKGETGGTGLGLSTVHGIITAAGGSLSVDSELGRGTTFYVHLPEAGAVAFPDQPEGEGATPEEPRRGRVLVVDDDEDTRTTLARTLSDHGYEVVAAATGEEALKVHQREGETIALVITDLRMPGMDGIELIDLMTAARPELPVIYMSAQAGPKEKAQFLSRGRAFLPKPFTVVELLTKVQRATGEPLDLTGIEGS